MCCWIWESIYEGHIQTHLCLVPLFTSSLTLHPVTQPDWMQHNLVTNKGLKTKAEMKNMNLWSVSMNWIIYGRPTSISFDRASSCLLKNEVTGPVIWSFASLIVQKGDRNVVSDTNNGCPSTWSHQIAVFDLLNCFLELWLKREKTLTIASGIQLQSKDTPEYRPHISCTLVEAGLLS